MAMPGGLTMLDVAIGLIVMYVLLSVLCSSMNEGIETFLKNRSKLLERGIREMLQDPDGAKVTHLLYNHPLVYGLFQGDYHAAFAKPDKLYEKTNLPSYIPSANFALAILDIILPATHAQPSGASAALTTGSQPGLVQQLREAALSFPVPQVGRGLVVLIDASGDDLMVLRKAIEKWFDTAMDRVSGWYKRRTQITLFVLALLVSGVMNIDTVRIVDRLLTDPAVRNSLISTAQEYARNGAGQATNKDWLAEVKTNESKLEGLGVPIGWTQDEASEKGKYPGRLSLYWFLKGVGILASALAATLGAPFWFDVLNRFVVIRSTIKPQEKSQPEGSKD